MCLVLRLNCPLLQFNSCIPNTSGPFLFKNLFIYYFVKTALKAAFLFTNKKAPGIYNRPKPQFKNIFFWKMTVK